MPMDVTPDQLDALRKLSTPTVSNAIELFDLRPRNHGFMSPAIRCLFPSLGVMAGFAVTARFAANQPGSGRHRATTPGRRCRKPPNLGSW
jgi:4-hydroxy-4-methyl-2-oxoglutarate aldolase